MAEKINQIELNGITYDLQDKDAKAPFTGTKAEVNAAIAAGEIKEGDIVNITDDTSGSGGGGTVGASDIIYLTQAEYDELLENNAVLNDVEYRITDVGVAGSANNLTYDNTNSKLKAINVQTAVDELNEKIGSGGSNIVYLTQEQYDNLPVEKLSNNIEYRITDASEHINAARDWAYDNTTSGLEALNVQDAIDEVNTNLKPQSVDISIVGTGATVETTRLRKVGNTITGTIKVAFNTAISTTNEYIAVINGKDIPCHDEVYSFYIGGSNILARMVIKGTQFTIKNIGSTTFDNGWTAMFPVTWATNG